ncbi:MULTISPECIES: DUF2231 domain-containing protein [unclassified Solwaraspora]|uniref:DUF2231 domain-containing protein n=1 Tax=unclassified Solwaraspora TaxID=2627926 RepID=UPI00259B7DB7|nr:DUF2231 domain-containing protein [Solwaraspora sp. WMMA2056]WJK39046.1 hypothetical protein O7608_21480 [Solwaraspora sp. WMMA2056]
MRGRLRAGTGPVQPMLVTLPLGLFVCATLFDVSVLAGAPGLFGEVGYATVVAGLAAIGLTLTVGLVDLWEEPPGRTRGALVRFNLVTGAMGSVFLIACLIRASGAGQVAGAALVVVELVGLAVGAVGLRYGTDLLRHAADVAVGEPPSRAGDRIVRQRTSVHPQSNPSPLSRRPGRASG